MGTAESEGHLHAHQHCRLDAEPALSAVRHMGYADIDGSNETSLYTHGSRKTGLAGKFLHIHQPIRLRECWLSAKNLVVDDLPHAARLSEIIAQHGSDLAG